MCKHCFRNGVPVIWKRRKVNKVQGEKDKKKKKSVGRASSQRRKKAKHIAGF